MAEPMSKTARVRAALRGEDVDRPPLSFWFHFGLEAESPAVVAELHVDLWRGFDLDWLKVMHDYAFGDTTGFGDVRTPAALAALAPVAADAGGFARQLEVLARVADAVSGEAWFVDTVFSPWSLAQILSAGRMTEWLRDEPAAVMAGLGVLAASLADYVPAALATGAAGIFYAVDGEAAADPAYQEHIAPLDEEVLARATGSPFNVLHVHGAGSDLRPHVGRAVGALSASMGPGASALDAVRAQCRGALMGGLDESVTLRHAAPGDVRREVWRVVADAGPGGLLLAPGCALRQGVPEENLWAVREAVETIPLRARADDDPTG